MSIYPWQLNKPISAVIFDCDGTLSAIEGIDELAKHNNVTDIVQRLTQEAMGKSGLNVDLYQQRLDLVRPTVEQMQQLGAEYITHLVPDIRAVTQLLQRLGKTIYVVSAGLLPAVTILGHALAIPAENIYAVDVEFDHHDQYKTFDHTSPLVKPHGKCVVVDAIMKTHPEVAYVGDGLNDLDVKESVTRFIGYGGIFYRENIRVRCEYYLMCASMAGILPLVLTEKEVGELKVEERMLFEKSEFLHK